MAPGRGRPGRLNSKSKKALNEDASNSQQKKITQFFGKDTLDPPPGKLNNLSSVSHPHPQCYSDVKQSSTSVSTKSKINSNVADIITLSDSDSDSEKPSLGVSRSQNENNKPSEKVIGVIKSDNYKSLSSSSNETKVDDSINSSSNSKVLTRSSLGSSSDGHKTPETDSDEDIFSQIDMDEIINSQENKVENTVSISSKVDQNQSLMLTSPHKLNSSQESSNSASQSPGSKRRTPTKSPKQKITKLSPVRHLKKRSRSISSGSSSRTSPLRNQKHSVSPSGKKNVNSETKNENNQGSQGTPVKRKLWSNAPYYWENFNSIIDSVMKDSHHDYLINEDDQQIVSKFKAMNFEAQCLYLRLFQRKWDWKAASTIKYPKISENLDPFFEELHLSKFLVEIKEDIPDTEKLLDLLSADQIQTLSKQMKVDTTKKTKENCKKNLMNATKKQQTLFGSSSDVIMKGALKLLGPTYQLEKISKDLFSRLFILYSPPGTEQEDEQDQTSNQLLKILLTDIGNMKYPTYNTMRSIRIYPDRDGLIRFHESWALLCEITAQLESKNWEDAIDICQRSLSQLKSILEDSLIFGHDINLPSFLRAYTSGSVLTRVCWLGVDGFQREKNYAGANEIIETLLSQDIYLPHYRGRWHERLVINMKHLKTSLLEVKKYLQTALSDKFILDAHKLTLSDRLRKLYEELKRAKAKQINKKSKQSKDDDRDVADDFSIQLFELENEIPSKSIEGEKLDNQGQGKSIFIGERDSSGSFRASSVELFAVEFYKTEGYTFGVHAEGAAVITIFGLLFWDEIYNDTISDTFHTPYQAFPLDLNFEDFYLRRESLLQEKLNLMLSVWTIEDVLNLLEENWAIHFDTLSIVNWSVFSTIDRAKSLVSAMGLQVTVKICERLLKNFRHCRSGFPDLVVWNEKKALFVEVKGPGDSLSPKQMLWIDYLIKIGAKAEVCHVVAVSNKRIRR